MASSRMEFRAYISAHGYTDGIGTQHVFVWVREDNQAKQVATNETTPPGWHRGIPNGGFYTALHEIALGSPDGISLTIVAPRGHELEAVFTQTREQRIALDYKRPNRKSSKPYAYEAEIRKIDAVSAERNILITIREPQGEHEEDMLKAAARAGEWRLKEARRAAETGEGKFY